MSCSSISPYPRSTCTPLLLFLLAGCSPAAPSQSCIPDHHRAWGAINPKVTQQNLKTTVCVSGWSRTIRPPAFYTNRLKAKQMRELNLPGSAHDYHEDHLVPLCAGGHPTDPRNLWPQPTVSYRDRLSSSQDV